MAVHKKGLLELTPEAQALVNLYYSQFPPLTTSTESVATSHFGALQRSAPTGNEPPRKRARVLLNDSGATPAPSHPAGSIAATLVAEAAVKAKLRPQVTVAAPPLVVKTDSLSARVASTQPPPFGSSSSSTSAVAGPMPPPSSRSLAAQLVAAAVARSDSLQPPLRSFSSSAVAVSAPPPSSQSLAAQIVAKPLLAFSSVPPQVGHSVTKPIPLPTAGLLASSSASHNYERDCACESCTLFNFPFSTWDFSEMETLESGTYCQAYRLRELIFKVSREKVGNETERGLKALRDEAQIYLKLKQRGVQGIPKLLGQFDLPRVLLRFPQNARDKLQSLHVNLKGRVNILTNEGPSLRNFLTTDYTISTLRLICKKLLEILAGFKKAGVLHGDLKPENIAYNPVTKAPVVLDMGSVTFENEIPLHDPTIWYKAPEYPLGLSTVSGDIWSLGCVFYELATHGAILFKADTDEALLKKICRRIGLPKKELVSQSALFSTYFFEENGALKLKSDPSLQVSSTGVIDCFPMLTFFNGASVVRDADNFSHLISQMLQWTNRPEPAALLKHAFFTS